MIERAYAYTANGRRIHYRRTGRGSLLVMLHPSRGSSFALTPLIEALAGRHTVIAIDTPGHGESEPLAVERPSIGDYSAALAEAFDALGVERANLYGTRTGAKIAVDFAVAQPARVRRLVLDGLALYTPDEQREMAEQYTPSLAPEPDGTHWIRAWAMLRNAAIFWPWFRRDRHSRIVADLPSAEDLHRGFVDFLRAVPEYWKAYQAAFAYDALATLRQTNVPTLLTAAADDPLAAHLARATDLPAAVRLQASAENHTDSIASFLEAEPLPAPPKPAVPSIPGVIRRDYGTSHVGQLLMRKSGSGAGRPLVLFHGSPGTSRALEPMMLTLGRERPVVTFDTPGIGDSDSPPPGTDIRDVAALIGEALDEHGYDEIDVYGTRTGSCIGIELAIARPTQVRRLVVDGPVMFTEEYLDWMLRSYLPMLTPQENGSHLLTAWNFRRDQQLFWPWFNHTRDGVLGRLAFTSDYEANNLTAEWLHRGFSDFLKGGLTYHIPYRAGIVYPTRQRLPLVTQPVLLCTNEHDVFRPGMPEARALLTNGWSRIYPDAGPHEAIAATLDLFRRFYAEEPLPPMLGEE